MIPSQLRDNPVVPAPEGRSSEPASANVSRRPPSTRTHEEPPFDYGSCILALETLRSALHDGLDRMVVLAQECSRPSETPQADLERRIQELEQARHRLQDESQRWEQTRLAQLEELEADRRRLAQSWERLEKEQVDHRNSAKSQAESFAREQAPIQTPRLAIPTSACDNPLSEAIVSQFEALRRDVRRNAKGRDSR